MTLDETADYQQKQEGEQFWERIQRIMISS